MPWKPEGAVLLASWRNSVYFCYRWGRPTAFVGQANTVARPSKQDAFVQDGHPGLEPSSASGNDLGHKKMRVGWGVALALEICLCETWGGISPLPRVTPLPWVTLLCVTLTLKIERWLASSASLKMLFGKFPPSWNLPRQSVTSFYSARISMSFPTSVRYKAPCKHGREAPRSLQHTAELPRATH